MEALTPFTGLYLTQTFQLAKVSIFRCRTNFPWYDSTIIGSMHPTLRVDPGRIPCNFRGFRILHAHRQESTLYPERSYFTACEICPVHNLLARRDVDALLCLLVQVFVVRSVDKIYSTKSCRQCMSFSTGQYVVEQAYPHGQWYSSSHRVQ